MIVVDIIQSDEATAIQISKYLIDNKYALQTHIDKNTLLQSGKKLKTIRLFFITKALLFDIIHNEVKDKFEKIELLIYATPVSHISKDFAEKLRLNLKAV
ncbi:MAG: hypothetical protein K9H41_04950 [Bacteroidia bacterium]|nr:hypothetical protein [Bacteroidia bacterium]